MYQCNMKYSGKENCKTPAIRAEDVESRFVDAVNKLIKNKKAFKIYVRLTNKTNLKAATYKLSENMDLV